jgi:hypothetical protein
MSTVSKFDDDCKDDFLSILQSKFGKYGKLILLLFKIKNLKVLFYFLKKKFLKKKVLFYILYF